MFWEIFRYVGFILIYLHFSKGSMVQNFTPFGSDTIRCCVCASLQTVLACLLSRGLISESFKKKKMCKKAVSPEVLSLVRCQAFSNILLLSYSLILSIIKYACGQKHLLQVYDRGYILRSSTIREKFGLVVELSLSLCKLICISLQDEQTAV